ncbi:uncharacterized protein LOC121935669 [Sceloporus undulatus]|uniref:uncharacterized protein LOC121935669 n=1 Tax=Sceloporus undulatus TaxID=8520 RepID=UPI001C4B32CF|nr:uncharacterized protein LOC121935669 [Sceloporus undulatus]XP_042333377.1 uncharacterized protein LOC121935669 [Sceloporus undulatus]
MELVTKPRKHNNKYAKEKNHCHSQASTSKTSSQLTSKTARLQGSSPARSEVIGSASQGDTTVQVPETPQGSAGSVEIVSATQQPQTEKFSEGKILESPPIARVSVTPLSAQPPTLEMLSTKPLPPLPSPHRRSSRSRSRSRSDSTDSDFSSYHSRRSHRYQHPQYYGQHSHRRHDHHNWRYFRSSSTGSSYSCYESSPGDNDRDYDWDHTHHYQNEAWPQYLRGRNHSRTYYQECPLEAAPPLPTVHHTEAPLQEISSLTHAEPVLPGTEPVQLVHEQPSQIAPSSQVELPAASPGGQPSASATLSSDSGSDSVSIPMLLEEVDFSSPFDDVKAFRGQVVRMAKSLGLGVMQPQERIDDPVYRFLQTRTTVLPTLPMLPTLLDVIHKSWETPSTIPSTSKRTEALYRVQDADMPWLSQHPKPNSLVVEAALSDRSYGLHSKPADKEGKKLDSMGKKLYSSAALICKISNYDACMSAYQYKLWENLTPFLNMLGEENRRVASLLQSEGLKLAKQQILTSRHIADCGANMLTGAVSLRRHAWLQNSGLSDRARWLIEDLPFDGVGLFNADTDAKLEHLHKMLSILKRLSSAP